MGLYDHIDRCIHVKKTELIEATVSREACKGLLDHVSAISKPGDGAPLVLLLFARMATVACDWLDGDLHIELVDQGDSTLFEVMTELGGGFGERVFPPFTMRAPLEEFAGAIDRLPQMILPLMLKRPPGRLILTATAEVRTSTMPPPIIEVFAEEPRLVIPPTPPLPHVTIRDSRPSFGQEGSTEPYGKVAPPEAGDSPGTSPAPSSDDKDIDGGWDP